MPPVPQPTTRMSVVTVDLMSFSAISGALPSQSPAFFVSVFFVTCSTGISPLACAMHFAAAFWTALDVMEAPETAFT